MSRIVINKMAAVIDGPVVKLVGGGAQPSHLGASNIVFTAVMDPAPPEFWDQPGKGSFYTVTIERHV